MAKPQEKTASTAVRPIAPPPLSQHLRELASRPGTWAVIARNLIPVVGIYGFGWSAALAVFNYWLDGLTALVANVASLSVGQRSTYAEMKFFVGKLRRAARASEVLP